MKTIRVEFSVPAAWRYVWAGLGLFSAALLLALTWYLYALSKSEKELRFQLDELQQQVGLRQTPPTQTASPRQAAAQRALASLQFDLNKVFSTIENVKVSGARLTAVTFDMGSGSLVLEYILESPSHAQAVTDALNSGYDSRPWRLNRVESTSAAAAGVSSQSAVYSSPRPTARASWQVAMHSL